VSAPDGEPLDVPSLDFTPIEETTPDPSASAGMEPDGGPPKRNGFRAWSERTGRRPPKSVKTDKSAPSWDITKTVIPNKKGQFVEPLMKLYASVGAAVMIADPICGTAIVTSAESCAKTLDDLAYQNEAVRRALYSLTTTSYLGAVLVAHLPIIMAVVMHHVPAAQQAFGQVGASMMEEYVKQVAEQNKGTDN
jgi:hypothetical protein